MNNSVKDDFHKLIDNIPEGKELEQFFLIIKDYYNDQRDIIDELTEKQKSRLNESIQQVQDGKTISHDKMIEKKNKWLKK